MQKLFYTTILLAGLLSVSCGKVDKNIIDNPDNGNGNGNGTAKAISLNLSVTDFAEKGVSTRATTPASDAEKAVKNIYLFLFPTATGQQLIKYSSGAAATEGAWIQNENKVTINKSQGEVGNREVYVVANCADIKGQLDAVTNLEGLKAVLKTTTPPWTLGSDIAEKGLLMVGNVTHNFSTNYQLKTIPLIRAVAKVNITFNLLSTQHQSTSTTPYGYKYINWGTQTWVVEKADQQVAGAVASHDGWQHPIPGIALDATGKVTTFSLTAYINEYTNTDEPTPAVEIKLPFDGGILPPPEFGEGDKYRFPLPLSIKRNTVYQINSDIISSHN